MWDLHHKWSIFNNSYATIEAHISLNLLVLKLYFERNYHQDFRFYISLTLCLKCNFEEKRKKGRKREGREGKRREWKGEKVFHSNLFNFWEVESLTKNIHRIPSNSFSPILLSKEGIPHPSKFLPFLSLYFLPSKHTLCSFIKSITLKLNFQLFILWLIRAST